MKKRLLLASVLLFKGALFALANPLSPAVEYEPLFNCCEDICLKVGYRGDFVYNRKLHSDQGLIKNFSVFSNEGVLSFNFARQADMYIYAGSNRLTLRTHQNGEALYMEFNSHVIGGFGATAILYQWFCKKIGLGALSLTGQYEDTSWTGTTLVTINGLRVPGRSAFRYREGAVSLALGQQIGVLIPYLALNWSEARVRVREDLTQGTVDVGPMLKNSRVFGLGLGISLIDAARMIITAEARLVNESALSINADFHF